MNPALLLPENGWPRVERTKMKDVVKGWNAVQPAANPSSASRNRDQSPMDTNWVHAQTDDSSRTSASRSESDWENDSAACLQSKDSVLMTVAQIQHVYRARARRNDERMAAKFAEIDKQLQLKKPVVRRRSQPKAAPEIDSTELESCLTIAQDAFSNLSVRRLSSDPAYYDELLGLIRTELLAGRDVCLHSDCARTGGSVRDTRLMLQQLCTRSLLFCLRDQDLVPQLVPPHALQLVLLPRHRSQ